MHPALRVVDGMGGLDLVGGIGKGVGYQTWRREMSGGDADVSH
jgi:hypothetical protein